MVVAIDFTGYVNVNPTYYYLNVCGIKLPYKNFTQTSIVVDTSTKLILNIMTNCIVKTTQSFIPMLDKLKYNNVRAFADKGCYSKELCCYFEKIILKYTHHLENSRVIRHSLITE